MPFGRTLARAPLKWARKIASFSPLARPVASLALSSKMLRAAQLFQRHLHPEMHLL